MPAKNIILAGGIGIALLYAIFQIGTTIYTSYRENNWRRRLEMGNDDHEPDIDEHDSWNDDQERNRIVCVICYEGGMNARNSRALPCGHTFHKDCLHRMIMAGGLLSTNRCPTCRMEFS